MREQLKQVDTSVIDELMDIKRERETVAERLARMNQEQGKVSDVVYRRVGSDQYLHYRRGCPPRQGLQ